MAKARLYEFIVGVETSAQPDAGAPVAANDLVTLGFLGTEIQETPTGVINNANTTFTLSQTPLSAGSFKLYLDGLLLDVATHYTRVGTTVTMITAPNFGQTLRANYRY